MMSASFEYSAMKSSFSLSSLGSAPAPPGGRCDRLERPYHSLTKKRKEPCREAWRRSWGSAASGGSAGDDLWPLLQHHYDYIMDNHIINTCKEANGELLSNNSTALQYGPRLLNPTTGFNRQWSLSQLIAEFTELCQWLTHIQQEIYSSPENLSSRKLRMTRMSELIAAEPRRAKFIEQASAILERIPEASAEVSWRVEHLNVKWEGLRQLLSPEQPTQDGDGPDTVDIAHELRCLRRWLHVMEGRLPPPSIAAMRAAPYHELLRKLREHQVLQRDVEGHRGVLSSILRLCAREDAARALERRWHLLYLRAIEWQCHLEACCNNTGEQGLVEAQSDSDDEPVPKQPRLSKRGNHPSDIRSSPQVELDYVLRNDSGESSSEYGAWCKMPDGDRRTGAGAGAGATAPDLIGRDHVDGGRCITNDVRSPERNKNKQETPQTVKRVDTSKFTQTDRKSDHMATFYFRHQDTDSDRQIIEDESSDDDWTYVGGAKITNNEPKDLMTPPSPHIGYDDHCRSDIERLINEAEELVKKKTQVKITKKLEERRQLKPLILDEDNSESKMSRIKEWLNSSNDDEKDIANPVEGYDASGEYTTESEMDTSLEGERNLHSSMDTAMSTSTCTVTPTHHCKVQLRKKRANSNARPWSVSCLSQLRGAAQSLAATPTAGDVTAISHIMSISESALNTLASSQHVTPTLRGSSNTVQGHVSSTNTVTEGCTATSEKLCWLRRKRLRHRRAGAVVKSQSFCGRATPERQEQDRSAASERFDSTSASSENSSQERNEIPSTVTPSFKLGPEGGPVRPRLVRTLGLDIGAPSRLWGLAVDQDSVTEEHSSFSEQAWDNYQEKYNSEVYSEAPDSDAARRLLEFGDDYRAFFDSQSDGCSSLSAHAQPDFDHGRSALRRRTPPSNPTKDTRKSTVDSPVDRTQRQKNTGVEVKDNRRRKELRRTLEYSSLETNERSEDTESGVRRRRHVESELCGAATAVSEARRCSSESEGDAEWEGVRPLVRRSSAQLQAAEALLARHDPPDLTDLTEIVSRCRENIGLLEAALARAGGSLSSTLQRDIRGVSARWSALRTTASRRGGYRRLRREISLLRDSLEELCEPGDFAPQPHTRAQLNKRIDELKERLSYLLDCKVSILKLTVVARRLVDDMESDDPRLAADLSSLLAAWEDAHQRTSSELVSLEKAVSAWAEWENALRELQGALKGDLATLKKLRERGNAVGDQSEVAAQIRQLAASLLEKKKQTGSTCDSLSDSGISDGDSEGAGVRARRLSALRELARRLQAALAPNSPAHRAITKRMEQTENEVRNLQESCRVLVEQNIPDLKVEVVQEKKVKGVAKTGSGDPDYTPRSSWVWRVLRTSLPFQICLVALLLTAWLVDRPRCCDALNSLANTLTPHLRYTNGPPPV